MNVISMMHKINVLPNPMIGESSLPDFGAASDEAAEFMRVRSLDQLNATFDGHVVRRSQQMNMLWHDDKCVQFVAPFSAMTKKSSQKNSAVRVSHEQSAAFPRYKSDEVSFRRGDESSGPQSKPQRLKAASAFEIRLARVELVPFPAIFRARIFVLGKRPYADGPKFEPEPRRVAGSIAAEELPKDE